MRCSGICTGAAAQEGDPFMAEDPLWTRLSLLQRASGTGRVSRVVIIVCPLLAIGCIRASGGALLPVEILVVVLSLWCVVVPDGHVGLAVVGLLSWQWVAQVHHPTFGASVAMASTVAVLHSALAACTVAPPSARWSRPMLRRWATRTAALIVASAVTAIVVHVTGKFDIGGSAVLLGATLAVVGAAAMWLSGNPGHRAQSVGARRLPSPSPGDRA